MNAGGFVVVRDRPVEVAEVEQHVADVVERHRQVDAVANLTADGERLAVERQRALEVAGAALLDGEIVEQPRDQLLMADGTRDRQCFAVDLGAARGVAVIGQAEARLLSARPARRDRRLRRRWRAPGRRA